MCDGKGPTLTVLTTKNGEFCGVTSNFLGGSGFVEDPEGVVFCSEVLCALTSSPSVTVSYGTGATAGNSVVDAAWQLNGGRTSLPTALSRRPSLLAGEHLRVRCWNFICRRDWRNRDS